MPPELFADGRSPSRPTKLSIGELDLTASELKVRKTHELVNRDRCTVQLYGISGAVRRLGASASLGKEVLR